MKSLVRSSSGGGLRRAIQGLGALGEDDLGLGLRSPATEPAAEARRTAAEDQGCCDYSHEPSLTHSALRPQGEALDGARLSAPGRIYAHGVSAR